MVGWICPKCNRGVNPNQNHCECTPVRFSPYQPTWIAPYPYYPYTTGTITSGNTINNEKIEYKDII